MVRAMEVDRHIKRGKTKKTTGWPGYASLVMVGGGAMKREGKNN